jgi:mono/diheme cytochrome c family protein
MKRVIWLCALATATAMLSAEAQLPPDAVSLKRVKISQKVKTETFCPVHKEFVESPVSTWTHGDVTYGGKTDECATLFAADADALHAGAERARWELNFVHSMSPIWCPVTDEISPGGNTKWHELGLIWESCCQFCNDTKAPEDFPRARQLLYSRAAEAFDLQGNHYVEDASSPVQGAIDLTGEGFPDEQEESAAPTEAPDPEFVPAWLSGEELAPTWAGGMGKLVENRCVECHRKGGPAPMAFQSHGQFKQWSKNLKVHIVAGTMPPWPSKRGKSYANEKRLTEKEKAAMLEWIDAGIPKGEGEYKMEREWGAWAIGTPDAVVALPEFTLPEDASEMVKEFEVETDFDSDKWIVATEVKPTDSFLTMKINAGPLGSYFRGNAVTTLPEGTAYLLKKGETVKVQVFYTKEEGWEEYDTDTKFALKFADGGSLKAVHQNALASDSFTIPAGQKEASATATYTLKQDSHIVALNPVLRARGKTVSITAKLPNGDQKELVAIPRWDNNWHFGYTLVEPFAAPKGTILTMTATYDNSELNALNPDASIDVKSGPGGELLEGWVSYTVDNEKSAMNRFGLSEDELKLASAGCDKYNNALKIESTD